MMVKPLVKVEHLVKKGGVVEVYSDKVVIILGLLHRDEIGMKDISGVQIMAARAEGETGKLLLLPHEGRGGVRELLFDLEHEHDAVVLKREIEDQLRLVKLEEDPDTGAEVRVGTITPLAKFDRLARNGGVVEVFADRVIVHGLNHDEVLLKDISEVQIITPKSGGGTGKLLLLPREDGAAPQEIVFDAEYERDAKFIKDEIEIQLMELLLEEESDACSKTLSSGSQAVSADGGALARAEELEKWVALREKGVLTQEEFEFKKKELLYSIRSPDGKEIVKIPCSYCGTLVDLSEAKCPSCGAPIQR